VVDDAQFADLAITVHRLEAKVDVALTQTQARVDEHGRLLATASKDLDSVERRVRDLENHSGGGFARLDAVERALVTLTERVTGHRAPQWPSIVASMVAATTLLLYVASVLYRGGSAVP
jgi:hypothetical protein